MIKPIFRLLLALFFGVQLTLGQNTAEIFGTISDGATGQSLAGANILIKNTYIGTASANDGSFHIPRLEPGNYNLVITMMGYRRQVQLVMVSDTSLSVKIAIKMQPDVLSSPQVVVTATRKVQDIMEAPVAVSVLGLRQINNKAAFSLEEILPYQAGISIVRDQINIRGANSYSLGAGNRSLLLLDGVPLTGSAAGNITWAVVPTSEIARIEIVKSSGSAQYGSSAMGGV
ncbi:MAG: TonB-dependent receptor, partial [Candidatus Marinimicrobia bacterium]|nr:TonB-dependent receptor [Candidatus Neomarinimicrobiota bacterium]